MFKEEDIEEDYVDSDFDADENELENNEEAQGDENDEEIESLGIDKWTTDTVEEYLNQILGN
jgi:hypothetical protein